TTFSAADRPVIFWTPDTGARVVRGAINAAWDKLGGSAGVLGVPTEDETYTGDEISQTFSGGQVVWNRRTNVFTTTPPELAEQLAGLEIPGDVTTAIAAARRAAGGPLGPLGAADGPQYSIGSDGAGQNYAGGKIFYSPKTGAAVLTGQVLAKYESVGGPQGDLGLPTSDENDGGIAPMSRIASFAAADQPVIFWTPDFGAVIVRGAMNAAWTKLGGAPGPLGAPTADQTENGDVVTQKFSGGAISFNTSTKAFTTEPANLQSQLAGLAVPGADVPQAPPAAGSPSDSSSSWFRPSRWWLLGIVPLLVLVGVVTAAVVINRRRHDDRAPLDDFDDDYDERDQHDYGDHDYDSGPVAVGAYREHDHDDHDHDDHDHDDHDRGDAAAGRRSGWAMPADEHGDPSLPEGEGRADGFQADLSTDQDAIDTTPTPIVTQEGGTPEAPWFSDLDESAHAAAAPEHEPDVGPEPAVAEPAAALEPQSEADEEAEPEPEPDSGLPSGRHAAIHLDEPVVPETSLRVADGHSLDAPQGYPIKADTKSGLYWTPGTGRYDSVRPEIWFASEEFALTNGFTKA
ncbi:MAG: hypothetical protein M3O32_20450, partial [Actinomycetota bacterium]|nr:hypothetical protein [Actinomycetota bacterium]